MDKMKNVVGFQNKNIRQLWLVLAINTDGYDLEIKKAFLAELKSYTHPSYSFEVRRQAFDFLLKKNLIDEEVLVNLVNASVHHNWRFRNYARTLLDSEIAKENKKEMILGLRSKLSEKELTYLLTKLD